ncbi:polyphosphate kinase 2 [Roseomonas sp. PWR1]|uniref:ADP/GDP-polyphosphate phosphotransferase n=1 Tax=Roseomonas nitratireducens TaxID=2820810 RepID=A0ABS4AQR3_9PROT|nr:polyphosphate kinase 2 [Neoroseomonas nitratireducens]MBP0463700.1 polyphosphate kinase 2 [Neoroseomonas nitratireducens]
MSKKQKQDGKKVRPRQESAPGGAAAGKERSIFKPDGKLTRKAYEKALHDLHVELVKLQMWTQKTGARVCIVFEGRDGAGKGGTIKAITERVSPRVFRTIALPAPTEREKSQMYIQRYIRHFPAAGEIVIFDRSWYNRAGVERVMGFVDDEHVRYFLDMAPGVEKAMVDSGIILLKYWLEVGMEEQTRRLAARIDDGRKLWKLSPMDLKSYSRWYDYSRARDAMFKATDSSWAPWYVVHSDDKKRARLNVIRHLLHHIPYEAPKREKVELPKRQKRGDYVEPDYPWKVIPDTVGTPPNAS